MDLIEKISNAKTPKELADAIAPLLDRAKPETKVVINGRRLALSDDGLFMENVNLSRDNTIVVKAEHKKGKKTIVRSFEVLY